MPINELSETRVNGCIYKLFDDTVVTLGEHDRGLYHFVNKGELVGTGSLRYVDEHSIKEAIVSADSFNKAIELFIDEYAVYGNGTLIEVEFFGLDLRDPEATPYVMSCTL